jgi:hypothetical protein
MRIFPVLSGALLVALHVVLHVLGTAPAGAAPARPSTARTGGSGKPSRYPLFTGTGVPAIFSFTEPSVDRVVK